MNERGSVNATLAERAWPAEVDGRVWRLVALVCAGVGLLTVSAKLNIPFYPVPVTMQTLAVMLIGAACGARLGGATVLAYLAAGAAGLPVFAGTPEKGIGLAYMMGPTGGYLMGFFVAAVITGMLAERGYGRSILRTALAMTIGTIIIFAFGLAWLGTLLGWDKPILEWGLYPFIYGAVLKIALGAAIMPAAWALLARLR